MEDHVVRLESVEVRQDVRNLVERITARRQRPLMTIAAMDSFEKTMIEGFAKQHAGCIFNRILQLMTSAVLLCVMARGFKWI